MTSPRTRARSLAPASIMVWAVNDETIEDREVLVRQFRDIRSAGFGGVAASVRCSRYTWNDPPARAAIRAIGRLCRGHGMSCWLGLDPRFVSRGLIGAGHGLEVLLFGDRTRADVFPHLVPAPAGVFSARCALAPRHGHMLHEVAIEYAPRGIVRVYAVQRGPKGTPPRRIIDITRFARLFYNARDRYVEAFGTFPAGQGRWEVMAFFRAAASHVDYSDRRQMRSYRALLTHLRREGCRLDGLVWDEPGFTCTYGTLPFSQPIRAAYRRAAGREIERDLWKLALDAPDGSHVKVRTTYHAAIQEAVNRAQGTTLRHARSLWGTGIVSGIHDTWHFESTDMCDMNHGSLDLWRAAATKTGGFVDLGAVNELRDPTSPWYAHLAAMCVVAPSLARLTRGCYAYNNLWTMGDDDGTGWQASVMSHCVDTMALFGTRWLAHAYGPVGTIGEERTFLGSPPLPGYPDHSTWQHFPAWNRLLENQIVTMEGRLPRTNLLVVYPVETMYALSDRRADDAARSVFALLLSLLDHHYHPEVLSPWACTGGTWAGRSLLIRGRAYEAVLFPFPQCAPLPLLRLLDRGRKQVLSVFGSPERTPDGRTAPALPPQHAPGIPDALAWLATRPGLRPIEAPEGCWVTITDMQEGGVLACLASSRHRSRYGGSVAFGERSVHLEDRSGLTRILFPPAAAPVLVPVSPRGGAPHRHRSTQPGRP